MGERVLKFIGMVIIVVAAGVSLTLLNLSLQKGGGSSSGAENAKEGVQSMAAGVEIPVAEGSAGAQGDAWERASERPEEPMAIDIDAFTKEALQPEAPAAGDVTQELQKVRTSADEQVEGAVSAGQAEEEVCLEAAWSSESDAGVFIKEESKFEETFIAVSGFDEESGEMFELLVADVDGGLAIRAEDYYGRLSEMDEKLTKREEEASKKTAADQKTAADEALKFWDDELNLVYQAIRASMTEEEFDELRTEEKAWLRSRDAAANEAAATANQSNSAQSLAYTQSLVESTKKRVYELAELYYGE
ncbi:MAG: DUF1311 domain-containing protein [Lachnospiraceae bacterium]|nr:DUF1311 domain-containing protein [Lachnospiraceae bacterium]